MDVNTCLIINLKSREDLWNSIEPFRKEWEKINKKIIRIDGIDLNSSSHNMNKLIISQRINLNAKGFRKNKVSVLGEFGCYLSHYKCWQYVLEHNLENALIMEDGICMLRNDYELLTIDKELDILFVNKEMKKYNEHIIDGYGLQGYVVTLNGAKKLLHTCKVLTYPIDLQLRNYCNSSILKGKTIDYPFLERNNNRESSISKVISDTDNLNKKQNLMHSFFERIVINLINKNVDLDEFI